jgi:hypothetical protein
MTNKGNAIEIEDLIIAENAKTQEQTVADILDTLKEFLRDDTSKAERAGMLKAIEIIKNNH